MEWCSGNMSLAPLIRILDKKVSDLTDTGTLQTARIDKKKIRNDDGLILNF